MTALTPDWLLEPISITSAEAEALLKAAESVDSALSGDTEDREARLARALADQGLLRWVTDGRWPEGSWLAYLTCPGWNALWRYFYDTHIDVCGASLWLPDGTCETCRAPRRLDRAAWLARLTILDPDEQAAETAHSALADRPSWWSGQRLGRSRDRAGMSRGSAAVGVGPRPALVGDGETRSSTVAAASRSWRHPLADLNARERPPLR